MTLNVFNKRKIAKTYNVMGLIKGEIEPGIPIIIDYIAVKYLKKYLFYK